MGKKGKKSKNQKKWEPPDWSAQIDPLFEHLDAWVGQDVEIYELITRVPGNFNRHFATSTRLVLRLEQIGMTISGAALTLYGRMGDHSVHYQIAFDLLDSLTMESEDVILLERLGDSSQRRTSIRLFTEAGPVG